MLLETLRVGCVALSVHEEIHSSCISLEIDAYQLLTPHGEDIPVLYRTLAELLEDEDKGFITPTAGWGRILRFPCYDTNVIQFTSGPVTVFVPLDRARQIFHDLRDVIIKAGLAPEDFTPKTPPSTLSEPTACAVIIIPRTF